MSLTDWIPSNLRGTLGTIFRIGSGAAGTQLKNNAGILEARNSGDAAFIKVRGDHPVDANDLVTKQFLDGIFGGPASTVGMSVLSNTNEEAGTWADYTVAASSDDASTFGFPGVLAGNTLYFGGDEPFTALETLVDTVVTLGSGVLAWEYWNGSAWVAVSVMAADSLAPYGQYADAVFGRAAATETVRFGSFSGWATKSLNSVTKYWVRARITSVITTSPAIDQVLLHPDHSEVNADGMIERFGVARTHGELSWFRAGEDLVYGATPTDENLTLSTNIVLDTSRNEFANGAIDSRGGPLTIPAGLDTSLPVVLEIFWYPLGASTGNVELEVDYLPLKAGAVLDGSLADTRIAQLISGLIATDQFKLRSSTFEIPVSTLNPSDLLGLRYFRDASGANADDTWPTSIVIVATRITGRFWR